MKLVGYLENAIELPFWKEYIHFYLIGCVLCATCHTSFFFLMSFIFIYVQEGS